MARSELLALSLCGSILQERGRTIDTGKVRPKFVVRSDRLDRVNLVVTGGASTAAGIQPTQEITERGHGQ